MANQTCQLLSVADSSMMVKGLDILDLVERLWADRPRDNDVLNKKTLLELLDKGEVQCGDEEVHKGLQKDILLDLDYEGEPDEEEVRAGGSVTFAEADQNKKIAVMIEASGKRIKSLAAFLTRVLESPEAPQNIEESHVLDLAFSGTNLTEQELKAILHIANALTPYVLKSVAALLGAHNNRKNDRRSTRSFESSPNRIRARHTLHLRNPRAVQRVAIEKKQRALQ